MPLLPKRPPVRVLPAPIDQRIRYACWATLVILIWGLLAESAQRALAASPWTLAALLIPGCLIYLYWRRSRFAAVALPTYFVVVSAAQLLYLHEGIGYFQLAILGWFLARGSSAIFEYHRDGTASKAAPSV